VTHYTDLDLDLDPDLDLDLDLDLACPPPRRPRGVWCRRAPGTKPAANRR
jgi:hypothetical protein